MGCHITGNYPDWWDGRCINDSGHVYWCVGVDKSSVRKVMQKELLGTSSIKVEERIGTGTIPRDNIIMDNIDKDGPAVNIIFIRHKDGGVNELHFYGSQNKDTMMGQSVKGVWFDEEPKYHSMWFYSQGTTRTATTDGFIIYTATPENGFTELNRLYSEGDRNLMYIQSVTWDDCPHLDEQTKKELLAGYPEWQWDMRTKGIPVIGSGAVFPYDDRTFTVTDTEIQLHWPTVCGVDFGKNKDPSVVVYCSNDGNPELDKRVYYLWHAKVFGDRPNDGPEVREPRAMADYILNGPIPNVVVQVPQDGGLSKDAAPDAKGKQLIEFGCNVYAQTFSNPSQTTMEFKKFNSGHVAHNSVEVGLTTMRRLFSEGRLKVDQSLTSFFREKQTYFYTESNKPIDRDNHTIDACRYAVMASYGNIGSTFEEATGIHKYDNNTYNKFNF